MLRLRTIMAAAIAIGATEPAAAQDFGSVRLQPGQMRTVKIIRPGDIRVCNDRASAGTVEVTIVPRYTRSLQPGECVEDRGWEIDFSNQSASQATVVYRRVCISAVCDD
jgi:hypothetical protein